MLRFPRLHVFVAAIAWAVAGWACASELQFGSVSSRSLDRDLSYAVYLPDGYEKGRSQYPVLYLLHGAGGNERAWVDRGHIQEKADRLIASGEIPPAIIVMPGCPACWWVDGTKDKAETAFWRDFVPAVQLRYRAIDARGGRLVAGLSAGGYGAVRFGLKYPDRIAAVAALSPAVYAEKVPAMSAARTQPPFLDPSGQFSQKLWDSLNYPNLLEGYFQQSKRVPFYLVSGDGDNLGIAFETALLFKRMFERQPTLCEFRVVDGDHSWKVWETQIDEAMRYIFQYAEKPRPVLRSAVATGLSRSIGR